MEVIDGDENDRTVRMRVSPQARAKSPDLPEFWQARAITVIDAQARKRILLSPLSDRRRYKPIDIRRCYDLRWGIETSYRELKQTMLGAALTLRSKTVEGVYQEIWGTLIAYNLVRLEIAKAADGEMRANGSELHPGLPPDPVRTTLGSGNALLRQIASFDETPARKAG